MNRSEPIPFYGEMGSTNPLFILPDALAKHSRDIASQLHGSFTLGAGQFCTKPGMVFLAESNGTADFLGELRHKVEQSSSFTLLTAGIAGAYQRETQSRRRNSHLAVLAEGQAGSESSAFGARAEVVEVDMPTLAANSDLGTEVFGPSSLLIRFSSKEQVLQAARSLTGHLTATIHGTDEDLREFAGLIQILKTKVGRIVFNGYPTGVEVCHAMIHGGPYPASTDGRTTSVGTLAVHRFARPVCYQDCPNAVLPDELKDDNPLAIWRMIDGQMTRQ